MNTQLQQWWKTVRAKQAELRQQFGSDAVYLVRLPNIDLGVAGGSIHMVTAKLAGRCLVEGSHRIATEDELNIWREKQELEGAANTAHESRMRGDRPYRLELGKKG